MRVIKKPHSRPKEKKIWSINLLIYINISIMIPSSILASRKNACNFSNAKVEKLLWMREWILEHPCLFTQCLSVFQSSCHQCDEWSPMEQWEFTQCLTSVSSGHHRDQWSPMEQWMLTQDLSVFEAVTSRSVIAYGAMGVDIMFVNISSGHHHVEQWVLAHCLLKFQAAAIVVSDRIWSNKCVWQCLSVFRADIVVSYRPWSNECWCSVCQCFKQRPTLLIISECMCNWVVALVQIMFLLRKSPVTFGPALPRNKS